MSRRRIVGLSVAGILLVGCTVRYPSPPVPSTTASSVTSAMPSVSPLSSVPSTPGPPTTSPTMSAAARKYLDSALDIMQRGALNRAKLPWPAIRQRALITAAGATSPSDTYSAIALALGELNDNGHSSLVPLLTGPAAAVRPLGPSQLPSGKLLPGPIGYVALPGVNERFAGQYLAAGAAVMRMLQAAHPDRWIVDLRSNTGGDTWPMLGGVQPLLGTGTIGSFVSPPKPASVVRTTPTELTEDGQVQIRIPVAAEQGASADPVVVLTGPITGSSGEFVTVVFRGRPCTTSMGAATGGKPTGNTEYRLSDGATLLLTEYLEADRTGRVYPPAPIEPDVEVGTNYNATWNQADPTIRAATHWLSLHRSCKP